MFYFSISFNLRFLGNLSAKKKNSFGVMCRSSVAEIRQKSSSAVLKSDLIDLHRPVVAKVGKGSMDLVIREITHL